MLSRSPGTRPCADRGCARRARTGRRWRPRRSEIASTAATRPGSVGCWIPIRHGLPGDASPAATRSPPAFTCALRAPARRRRSDRLVDGPALHDPRRVEAAVGTVPSGVEAAVRPIRGPRRPASRSCAAPGWRRRGGARPPRPGSPRCRPEQAESLVHRVEPRDARARGPTARPAAAGRRWSRPCPSRARRRTRRSCPWGRPSGAIIGLAQAVQPGRVERGLERLRVRLAGVGRARHAVDAGALRLRASVMQDGLRLLEIWPDRPPEGSSSAVTSVTCPFSIVTETWTGP